MKIGGKSIASRPSSELIVFPREDAPIVLRAHAMMDREEFDKLVPPPKPPKKTIKGGKKVDDLENPRFLESQSQMGAKYVQYMIITGLTGATTDPDDNPPIEWDTVVKQDPGTWANWEIDLKNAGVSQAERQMILGTIMKVNSLSEDRLDEARKSFLLPAPVEEDESSSLEEEPNATLSGVPASDSE